MKRTPIRKIGEIGKANIQARKIIAEISEEKNLNYCEIGFEDCLRNMFLAPAHREKRAFYRGDVDELSRYENWVSSCVSCHKKIEFNKELTEEVFERLRG